MTTRVNLPQTKQAAEKWVESGNPCTFRYGWGWKGASARYLTKDEAIEKLKKHSFCVGFYTLWWEMEDGQIVLNFNELSENDML